MNQSQQEKPVPLRSQSVPPSPPSSVSELLPQKAPNLLQQSPRQPVEMDSSVISGTGNPKYEQLVQSLRQRHPKTTRKGTPTPTETAVMIERNKAAATQNGIGSPPAARPAFPPEFGGEASVSGKRKRGKKLQDSSTIGTGQAPVKQKQRRPRKQKLVPRDEPMEVDDVSVTSVKPKRGRKSKKAGCPGVQLDVEPSPPRRRKKTSGGSTTAVKKVKQVSKVRVAKAKLPAGWRSPFSSVSTKKEKQTPSKRSRAYTKRKLIERDDRTGLADRSEVVLLGKRKREDEDTESDLLENQSTTKRQKLTAKRRVSFQL